MASIWSDTVTMSQFPTLEKDIRTKVLIIGGGLSGILCAYFLQQAGVDYCLLEKDRICGGITKDTTAKITSLQGLVYDDLLRSVGRERTKLFWKANELAVKRFRDFGWYVDCHMEEKDAYVYVKTEKSRLERELEALNKISASVDYVGQVNLPFQTAGAIRHKHQLQFHPLKFAAGIAKNLRIYENSGVREMTEYFALTAHGSVAAEKVIVATHFPFINKRGSYFMKLYQERSYVAALKNAMKLDGMYIGGEKQGLSFRNMDDLLLMSGLSHRTGKKPGIEEIERVAGEYFKDAQIVETWATQDCMSLDRMPYIGKYSSTTQDLYVATGYNGWGMTGTMLSAMILSDLVQEKENEFAAAFSPSRSILRPQLAINMWEAAKGMLCPGQGRRCSHMGCVLHWNNKEQAWECSCHGSRFDKDGTLLDNPARCGLKTMDK